MLTVDEEIRIVEAAPPYLRVAIVLRSQTGGRTYSEGLSLRWDQVDFEQRLIRLDNKVKTQGSAAPSPYPTSPAPYCRHGRGHWLLRVPTSSRARNTQIGRFRRLRRPGLQLSNVQA